MKGWQSSQMIFFSWNIFKFPDTSKSSRWRGYTFFHVRFVSFVTTHRVASMPQSLMSVSLCISTPPTVPAINQQLLMWRESILSDYQENFGFMSIPGHGDYKRPPLSQLFHISARKSMANLLTKFQTRFTTPSDIMENAFFAALWRALKVLASPSSSFSVCRSSNSPDTWMKKKHSVKELLGPIPSVKQEFYHAQPISVSRRKRGKSRSKNIYIYHSSYDWPSLITFMEEQLSWWSNLLCNGVLVTEWCFV